MKAFRFVLSREWLGYIALLIVFALACVLLSNWQFARRAEAAAQNHLVAANWQSEPVALDQLIGSDGAFASNDTYRQVTLRGSYRLSDELLVRNRPRDGQPGFEQLIPFESVDGTVVVIDRGWLPTGSDGGVPEVVPQPESGTLTVVARMKPGEPTVARTAPEGQVASIDLPLISQITGVNIVTSAYGLLAEENPAAATTPVAATPPSWNEGMHLSYALQWLAFIVIAAVGFVYAARTNARRRREDAAAGVAHATISPRTRKRDADAEYEDAVLDAQEHADSPSSSAMRG